MSARERMWPYAAAGSKGVSVKQEPSWTSWWGQSRAWLVLMRPLEAAKRPAGVRG